MQKRKIYIGADSAGYGLKCEVIPYLIEKGYEVVDCGTDSAASCHYPEFANAVCEKVKICNSLVRVLTLQNAYCML